VPFPDFDPVLLQIGPFALRWYALAYIAGIALGWWWGRRLSDERLWAGPPPLSKAQVDDFVLWVAFGIILGGRLGYVLFYHPEWIISDPLAAVRIWDGGMSFHGGFLGVAVATAIFALRHGVDMLSLGDLVAPCVPFGLFFGRIANFINGELWGRPTDVPWGIVFPTGGPEPRHPSQLYEAALEGVVLFLILAWAVYGARWLPRRGAVTGLFLVFYGLFRILVEMVREPDAHLQDLPFDLTMGMILSVPMVLVGAWLLARSRRSEHQPSAQALG
jgi:phosphatidylglycerol---prolipoprotein diacylglyceryl transferase